MQRLIANLLMCWMLLLVPGATALELAQPEILLPACCRTHGAHHCMMAAAMASANAANKPVWRGPSCPFSYLLHAAVLLTPYLPASRPHFAGSAQAARVIVAKQSALAIYLAGLPASRAPPILSWTPLCACISSPA